MIAPLLGGQLLVIDRRFPVYAATVIFVIAGLAVLALPKEKPKSASGSRGDGYHLAH